MGNYFMLPLKRLLICATAISAATGITAITSKAADAAFYDGKTITVMVGLRAGGTADTFARSFASFWQKHIPGNPNIIVKNLPGGGGLKATNFVAEKAKKDGLTVLWGPWDPLAQALNRKSLRTKYQNFGFLGGTGDIRLVYGRTDIIPGGIKKAADIKKAASVSIGGSTATGLQGLLGRLSLDVLGLNFKYIKGYRGGSGVFAAIKRKEVQLGSTSITSFRTRSADFVKTGEGRGYFYLTPVEANGTFKRSPFIKEMPAYPDLYKQMHGKMPSGAKWDAFNYMVSLIAEMTFVGLAPGGIPAEALADLQKGYAGGSNDPGFIKQSVKKFGLPYVFVNVKKGQRVFASLADAPPKVIATLKEIVAAAGK
jgi:tripartite-type tricarboxylate transporter receptor subunit TctC